MHTGLYILAVEIGAAEHTNADHQEAEEQETGGGEGGETAGTDIQLDETWGAAVNRLGFYIVGGLK